jgi:hypothetical protein
VDQTQPVSAVHVVDVELSVQSGALPRQKPPVGGWQPGTVEQDDKFTVEQDV